MEKLSNTITKNEKDCVDISYSIALTELVYVGENKYPVWLKLD